MLLGLEKNMLNNENRLITSVPEFNIKAPMKTIGDYKNYYLENFGLKTSLVNSYIYFKNTFLKESPIPNRVVLGKNEWYFLGNHFNNKLNNVFGNDRLTTKELKKITKSISDINTYLKYKNIEFYVIIPPDKSTIYKEHLPFSLTPNETKLEQLKKYLNTNTDFKILDLSERLQHHKPKPIYLKTDSHWNDYGAYYGYQASINFINKNHSLNEIYTIPIDSFKLKTINYTAGGTTKMINLQASIVDTILTKQSNYIELLNSSNGFKYYKNQQQHLKLLMYCDSFSNAWTKFFNESFDECIYLRDYTINKAFIEKVKPDIVIIEIIERNFDNLFLRKNPLLN
jgi:hypothetical protein